MNCRKDTPQCEEKHRRDGFLIVNQCCHEKLVEILQDVVLVFKRNKVDFWLDYGTLLGYTREGKRIPHDIDIDLCAFEKDKELIEKALIELVLHKKYVIQKDEFNNTGLQVYYSEVNKLHLDVFFWHENGDKMEKSFYLNDRKGKGFPKEWLTPLVEAKFEGVEVFVPKEKEKLCEHRYGKEWRTPMSIFSFNKLIDEKNNKK